MHFSFSTFFSVSRYNSGHTVFVSNFPRFSVFSPYSRSYSVHISLFKFLTVSQHIPVQRVLLLIFYLFQFSCYITGPTVCLSHFYLFQCSSPYFTSYSVYFSFHDLQFFSPYSRSYNFAFLIFHVFHCF